MTSKVHPVDEVLPAGKLTALGLQHVLVMYAGAVAVPLIVGRALKLSWRNGTEAPGDPEDDAHGIYQIDIDEARAGPAVAAFSYAQRQSAPREPLPRSATDHIARLLDFYGRVEARLLPNE